MTLNQLVYFKKLAETSHMQQAANELFISQPSLSAAMAKLEESLGVKLFSRRGHQLSLTAEGREFLSHAERILRETDEAQEHMRRLADHLDTHIHLGCIAPVLYGYLPRAMNSFLAQPGCDGFDFEFSVENNDELIHKLKGGLYEFVLCSQRDEDVLSQVKVLSEPLAVVSPADAPPAPKTWEALAPEVHIGCEGGSFLDRMMCDISAKYGVSFRYAYRATAEEGIVSLVEHGFGRAIMPWSAALMKKYAVSRGELPEGDYARDVFLTTLRGRELSGAAAQFVGYLMEQA